MKFLLKNYEQRHGLFEKYLFTNEINILHNKQFARQRKAGL
jgi:hypothetical protein